MNVRNTFIAILLALSVQLSLTAQLPSGNKATEILILHTNDMHARIDNMAKLAYLADSLRKTHPHVFLVAAGDNFTGNPAVDMVADKGYPMIDIMNRCKFDVSALGNHEFDLGLEFLSKRIAQARFPFICCNITTAGTILKQPAPYVILDAGENAKVAFLGIIELGENGIPDSHPSKMTGLKFTDGITAALQYSELKKQCNVLVGLTHLGVLDDVKLAREMPSLDLIIGGHSHTLIDTVMIVNGVLITQAGSSLKYVGKTTLMVENGKITSRKDEIIALAKLRGIDRGIQEVVAKYNNNKELQRVVATTGKGLEGYDELGSLMTDALVAQMKVDFAFQNKGGIRISYIPAGDIKLSDIYKLDPFGNQVVIFNLSPKEIQSLICSAFHREKQLDLEVSGMTYTLTIDSLQQCVKTEMLDKKMKPLDESKTYKVALNSYVAASYHFDHADPGTTSYTTTAQALIDYLTKVKTVDYKGTRRIFMNRAGGLK